jgi:hypothetical protein
MSRTDKDTPTSRRTGSRQWGSGPPRDFIGWVWTAQQRQAVRVECLNAAKEYRADGEVDTLPTVDQHHHGAKWLWF